MPLQKKKKKKKTAYKKTGSVTQIVNVNVGSSPAKKKRKKRASGSGGGVDPMGGLRGQSTTFAQSAPPPQIIYTPEATTRSLAGLIDQPQRPQLTQGEEFFGRRPPALMRASSSFDSRQSSLAGSMYSIDTALSSTGQELLRSTSGQSALHSPRGVNVKKAPYPLDIPLQTGSPATQELHPQQTIRVRLSAAELRRRKAKREQEAREDLASGGASIMDPIDE
jgi:hypothetical protein